MGTSLTTHCQWVWYVAEVEGEEMGDRGGGGRGERQRRGEKEERGKADGERDRKAGVIII